MGSADVAWFTEPHQFPLVAVGFALFSFLIGFLVGEMRVVDRALSIAIGTSLISDFGIGLPLCVASTLNFNWAVASRATEATIRRVARRDLIMAE